MKARKSTLFIGQNRIKKTRHINSMLQQKPICLEGAEETDHGWNENSHRDLVLECANHVGASYFEIEAGVKPTSASSNTVTALRRKWPGEIRLSSNQNDKIISPLTVIANDGTGVAKERTAVE
jgi:hypothetical protein